MCVSSGLIIIKAVVRAASDPGGRDLGLCGSTVSRDGHFPRGNVLEIPWASLPVQTVKTLPAMQEAWIQSLGGEDPLEEGLATHSSTLAWRIPHGQRSLAGCSPWGHRVGHA